MANTCYTHINIDECSFFQHFANPDEARQAAENLDGAPFEGINLKVEVGDICMCMNSKSVFKRHAERS